MHFFVTGAAGFIGSNAVDRMLERGHKVTGYDNFSTGFEEFLVGARKNANFQLVQGDLKDTARVTEAMAGAESVWHFAANADVRFGLQHPGKDLEQNTTVTFNVLEAARANGIKNIVFSSTGSVYGECPVIPTPEDAPFPIQTSLYGASKLACEALIQAYCEGFGFEGRIFRFVSILGPRYTHGHVIDFYRQLRQDPTRLNVLGDGHQKKSYLHVSDCIDAIFHTFDKPLTKQGLGSSDVFNLGVSNYCEVLDSVGWISETLKIKPTVALSGGKQGWVGDNPFIFLETKKILSTGWKPRYSIKEGVTETLAWLDKNAWVLERRD